MNPRQGDEPGRCPSQGTLVDFHLGKLSDTDLVALADHLGTCAHCAKTLRRLADGVSDGISKRLRQWLERPALLQEAGWERMKAGAEAILSHEGQSTTEVNGGQATQERWIGRTIGHYVILDRISKGGMGVVYRARQEPIGRLVAVKMILAGIHAPEHTLNRFITEGRAAGRLQHPNVVQIYEFAEHDGLPFYAMELVEGGSLKEKLERGPLQPGEAALLVRTLAEAVEFAHEKQVLHRDLKPGNILLATDGTPRIADFGLAKLLDRDGEGYTVSNTVLGTPAYMAPEQAGADRQRSGGRPMCTHWGLSSTNAWLAGHHFVARRCSRRSNWCEKRSRSHRRTTDTGCLLGWTRFA